MEFRILGLGKTQLKEKGGGGKGEEGFGVFVGGKEKKTSESGPYCVGTGGKTGPSKKKKRGRKKILRSHPRRAPSPDLGGKKGEK